MKTGNKIATLAVVATILEAQDAPFTGPNFGEEKNHAAVTGEQVLHEHEKEVPSPIYCGSKHDGTTVCLELAHMHPLSDNFQEDETVDKPV